MIEPLQPPPYIAPILRSLSEVQKERETGTCDDCGERAVLRDYDADNFAKTEAVHYELCADCYEERSV